MANQLIKTGITPGQTIQPFHVTQSVDAFTGITAYDITISGSLTLTGSVLSQNGFTGNLIGTSSWATNAVAANTASWALNAITSSYTLSALSSSYALSSSFALTSISSSYSVSSSYAVISLSSSFALSSSRATEAGITTLIRPSNTVSNFGYTVPYLSGTGSTATLFYSATGPRYNPTTETVTSTNFEGTASWANNVVTATNLNGVAYLSGSAVGAASIFKFIAGASKTGNPTPIAAIGISQLSGKVLGQTCFVTATVSGSGANSIVVNGLTGITLTFESQTPGTDFHYHIMYI
jgi:hypothetical protein